MYILNDRAEILAVLFASCMFSCITVVCRNSGEFIAFTLLCSVHSVPRTGRELQLIVRNNIYLYILVVKVQKNKNTNGELINDKHTYLHMANNQ